MSNKAVMIVFDPLIESRLSQSPLYPILRTDKLLIKHILYRYPVEEGIDHATRSKHIIMYVAMLFYPSYLESRY